MIWKNFSREFAGTISRLVSVVIITAVAVMIYVALSGLTYNAKSIASNYLEQQNAADYWISGSGFNKSDCNKISALDSVEDIEPRVVFDCEDRYDSSVTLALYSMTDNMSVNLPYIVEGTFPENNREIMISDQFAAAHGLSVGDTYEMKIIGTDRIIKSNISALIKNPECLQHVNANTMTPDFSKYGFAYIKEDAVSDLFGKNIYNQICITTNDNDADIKKELSDILGVKLVNILALEDNMNAYSLIDLMSGIETIVMVFPIIFFLVAILIMFSTMSRLIENARGTIGTFKALGYSDRKIMLYYLLYAVFVVVLGYIIGVLPANKMLTTPVLNILVANADLPPYTVRYKFQSLIVSFVIVFVICVGTAFYITAKSLRENPAQCMRPKSPPAAKKILPERIPALWSRLNFTGKYIIRNMLRNKSRMIICIVGIAGCMTLILTAYGINDSIANYLDLMTEKQHKYDVSVSFESSVTPAQYKHIGELSCVTEKEYEMTTGVKLYSDDKYESTYIKVCEDEIYLKLIDMYGDEFYHLPDDGIILDADIAERLELAEGDSVTLKFPGDNRYYKVNVSKIYSGVSYAYAGRSFWRSLGKEFTPTSAYLTASDISELGDRLESYDFVDSYALKEETTTAVKNNVNTMVTIVYLLIIFGGVLAVVVLYNLGIMSFYEQIRNLATLMVLGFRNDEIKKLVLSENIIFAFMGSIIGMPLGIQLANGIIKAINTVYFELIIYPKSYLLAVLLTLGFAMIVNMMLSRKMKNIDMLGALKSVE